MSSWPELAITWVAWRVLGIAIYQMSSNISYHGDNIRMVWKVCEPPEDKLFKPHIVAAPTYKVKKTGSRIGS